jgi:plasmid stabilization system protein ParE/predicted transcriptional regulator
MQEVQPMATTSLKLSEELKQRAIAAAGKKGVPPHAFMVQAIERAATAAELRASFVSEAQAAREKMVSTGEGFDVDEVHAYLKARCRQQSCKAESQILAKLSYSERALTDLERLTDLLIDNNPAAAAETLELIEEAVDLLIRHTLVGRVEYGLHSPCQPPIEAYGLWSLVALSSSA